MIPLLVIAVAVVTSAILVGARVVFGQAEPLDVERDERWLVTHAPTWMRSTMRRLDRHVIGGVAVAAVFGAIFVCALAVGWIFNTLDNNRGLARWDQSAAEWGSENATDGSTRILEAVTKFGGTQYLLVLMLLVGLAAALRPRKRGPREWGPFAYLAVIGLGVSLLNNGLKMIVDRDRPNLDPLTGFAGSSFPSGHSAAAAACWAGIALVIARRRSNTVRTALSFAAVTVAIAVAASRVLLGVHWLTDAVAGVAVGWTWFFTTTVIFGGRFLKFGEPADRVALNQTSPPREDEERLADPSDDDHASSDHEQRTTR